MIPSLSGRMETFRYPKRLTLVTPGDLIDDSVDGDFHITRRKTPTPIRVAGFNLVAGTGRVPAVTRGRVT